MDLLLILFRGPEMFKIAVRSVINNPCKARHGVDVNPIPLDTKCFLEQTGIEAQLDNSASDGPYTSTQGTEGPLRVSNIGRSERFGMMQKCMRR